MNYRGERRIHRTSRVAPGGRGLTDRERRASRKSQAHRAGGTAGAGGASAGPAPRMPTAPEENSRPDDEGP